MRKMVCSLETKQALDNVSNCPGDRKKDKDLFYFREKSIAGKQIQWTGIGDLLFAEVTERGR